MRPVAHALPIRFTVTFKCTHATTACRSAWRSRPCSKEQEIKAISNELQAERQRAEALVSDMPREHRQLYTQLKEEGIGIESMRQVHAPIGLEIGAVTPQEIGVSILAELIAVKHGRITGRDAAALSMKWVPAKL